MSQLVHVGDFCPNPACADYGKPQLSERTAIIKYVRLETQDVPGRRWWPRSPVMAAGLTDHLWTVKELLTTVVLPNT